MKLRVSIERDGQEPTEVGNPWLTDIEKQTQQ